MNVTFRVRVAPPGGEDVILEHFEAQSDAEKFFNDLLSESEDNIINSLGFKTLTVTMEELYYGTWVVKTRKAVVI